MDALRRANDVRVRRAKLKKDLKDGRVRIETILDWATVRGYRKGENPARWRGHLDKLLPARGRVRKVEHHAALPYRAIPAFITELREQEGLVCPPELKRHLEEDAAVTMNPSTAAATRRRANGALCSGTSIPGRFSTSAC